MSKIKFYLTVFLLLPLSLCFAQENQSPDFYAQPAKRFIGLRAQAFGNSANTIGIKVASASEPWGVIMEIGYPQAIVTLVVLKDGTASLYFANGGTVIGGKEDKGVSESAKNLVTVSGDFISRMSKTQDYPLPELGKARFYVFNESGIFASEFVDEKELKDGAHRLSGLFYLGHEVIAALRKIDKKQ